MARKASDEAPADAAAGALPVVDANEASSNGTLIGTVM